MEKRLEGIIDGATKTIVAAVLGFWATVVLLLLISPGLRLDGVLTLLHGKAIVANYDIVYESGNVAFYPKNPEVGDITTKNDFYCKGRPEISTGQKDGGQVFCRRLFFPKPAEPAAETPQAPPLSGAQP